MLQVGSLIPEMQVVRARQDNGRELILVDFRERFRGSFDGLPLCKPTWSHPSSFPATSSATNLNPARCMGGMALARLVWRRSNVKWADRQEPCSLSKARAWPIDHGCGNWPGEAGVQCTALQVTSRWDSGVLHLYNPRLQNIRISVLSLTNPLHVGSVSQSTLVVYATQTPDVLGICHKPQMSLRVPE